MPEEQTPATSSPPSSVSYPSLVVRIILALIVLFGVAFFTYAPFGNAVTSWWQGISAPSIVRDSVYIGEVNGKGVLYTIGLFGLSTRSYGEYSLKEIAIAGRTKVAILEKNGQYDIFTISGGKKVQLTTDGKKKMALTVSSDGASVAYAVQNRTIPLKDTPPYEVYNLLEFDVHVTDTEGVKDMTVGPGNHPAFIEDGLFYLAPQGYVWRAPGDNGYDEGDIGSILKETAQYRIASMNELYEEGTFAFPSVLLAQYDTLRIISVNPLSIAPASLPIPVPPGTRSLTDTDLGETYILVHSPEQGSGVARLSSPETVETIYSFPAGVSPHSMVVKK